MFPPRLSLPIGRHIIVISQVLRDVEERPRQSRRSKFRAVRLDGDQKDYELRIVCGKVAEKRVQKTVFVVSATARDRYLRCARLRRDGVMFLFQDAAKERFV